MKLYYFKLKVLALDFGPAELRNKALGKIHGFMRQTQTKLAVAPDFRKNTLTVFFDSTAAATAFEQNVLNQPLLKSYFEVSGLQELETEAHQGRWFSFVHRKIPAIGSLATRHEQHKGIRDRIMKQVQKLPYFQVTPKSSGGTSFRYYFEPRKELGFSSFEPNGYGLSRSSLPFALPEV